jgi:hypothetical protein
VSHMSHQPFLPLQRVLVLPMLFCALLAFHKPVAEQEVRR